MEGRQGAGRMHVSHMELQANYQEYVTIFAGQKQTVSPSPAYIPPKWMFGAQSGTARLRGVGGG